MGKIIGNEQRLEKVTDIFYDSIKKSWTYARITEEEKIRLENVLYSTQTKECVKGIYIQRWRILQAIYNSFLMALDYKPIGWREEEQPLF